MLKKPAYKRPTVAGALHPHSLGAIIQPLIPTDEVSIHEKPHPDNNVVSRLVEVALSDCPNGCKIYADPRSKFTVLAHSAVYGCRK